MKKIMLVLALFVVLCGLSFADSYNVAVTTSPQSASVVASFVDGVYAMNYGSWTVVLVLLDVTTVKATFLVPAHDYIALALGDINKLAFNTNVKVRCFCYVKDSPATLDPITTTSSYARVPTNCEVTLSYKKR